MLTLTRFNKKGLTLIELLVGLVICAMVVAGIYRLFIAQSRAYTVQDQVVEVQQSIRGAMDVMLRDLRMTGFDDDRTPLVIIPQPPLDAGDNSITVSYEYNNSLYQERYWLQTGTCPAPFEGSVDCLLRQETINGASTPTESILDNVNTLDFRYGIDENEDGAMDDLNVVGVRDDDWVTAGSLGSRKVIAVRVRLTATPTQINPDVQTVSRRTLVSAVTFRNLSLMR